LKFPRKEIAKIVFSVPMVWPLLVKISKALLVFFNA